ncbi:calcium/sodium antiporter [Paramaledivibacter caminithermalis]|jgi:cation:H+ antiporter|uniref:Cation:H+ antiporter n=1 Tax=Paramaledivibacter caminithermalis (strain DSM 15212 / CIP 107654 / DViRD3) TaxID=1121301 RepID=A0A1M6LWB6_PARC5|nr:calcium/sodium antiporter [Paramaledivibacter caminithermalis]SHJ75499.1 cation:H+ antiporter [Paramaledivibacter caminithermalis DSM 15212]
MDYIALLLGFVFLIKGADFFVDGSSSIAKKLKVPSILIGLTIVAFGTSAPEALVSINAALKGVNEIAIGNVVGSNLFNFLIVVGVSSVINPLKVKKGTILKEFPFAILASFVLFILSADKLLQETSDNFLSKADGLILLSLFLVFLYYLIELAILGKEDYKEEIKDKPLSKSILFSILGVIGIMIGAELVVNSSSLIAIRLGMSENLVGLTIVAIGTSLPELVTSIVAAIKKESDIAMGNVIGSNMFNILFVLGISSAIRPIPINSGIFFDMICLLLVTVITYIFSITKKVVFRSEGIFLTLSYIIYMWYIIIRN